MDSKLGLPSLSSSLDGSMTCCNNQLPKAVNDDERLLELPFVGIYSTRFFVGIA